MSFLCAGKGKFKHLREFQENSQKIHAIEEPRRQKMAQKGPPLAAPPTRLVRWGHPQAPFGWYFYSRRENPETAVDTPILVAEPPPPMFFSGRANLEAVLASSEGKSTPSSSPSLVYH